MSLKVKYGVSTWLWVSPFRTQIAEALFSKIAGFGFDAVEIAIDDPAVIDAKIIKKLLEASGLKATICAALNESRDLTSDSLKVQQSGFDYIEQCLDICNYLDAEFLGGPLYAAVGKARILTPSQRKYEWDLAVTNLQKVCRMASSRKLKIAIEPLNRFESDLVNTADDAIRLINDIDDPAANIMLDSFHMSIEERDVEKAIVAAGDKLIHFQVSENYRGTPGTGQTPWHAYKRGLEQIKYNRTISIESFTTDNAMLADAVCFWHPKAESQDELAQNGLSFLKKWAAEINDVAQTPNSKSVFEHEKEN